MIKTKMYGIMSLSSSIGDTTFFLHPCHFLVGLLQMPVLCSYYEICQDLKCRNN
jgi:hypothetical protein